MRGASPPHAPQRQPRRRRPRGVGRKPADSSAVASGESNTASPSALSTVSRPSAPSLTADGQRRRRRFEHRRVVAPGQQRLAAALDVEHQLTVDQHHQRAGLPAGPVRARRLPGPAGQGRAAPYGFAGSAAASTTARRPRRAAPAGRRPRLGRTAGPRARPPRPAPASGRPHPAPRTAQRQALRRSTRAGTGRPPPSRAAPGTQRRTRPVSARPRPLPGSARRAGRAALRLRVCAHRGRAAVGVRLPVRQQRPAAGHGRRPARDGSAGRRSPPPP